MICIIKAVFAWIILLIVGQTLVGGAVRGIFWSPPVIDPPTDHLRKLLGNESRRLYVANTTMTVLFLVMMVVFIFLLYYFWNFGLAVSAGLLMISRLPDLIWKIRAGDKIYKFSLPKGAIYIVSFLLTLLSLPLTWYSLCKWLI